MKSLLLAFWCAGICAFGQTGGIQSMDARIQQILDDAKAADPTQQTFYGRWMAKHPALCAMAEMKKQDLKAWLVAQGMPGDKLPLKAGEISLDKLTMLSPAGAKVFTDSGIKTMGWDELSPDLAARFGWNHRVQERYIQAKAVEDQEARSQQAMQRRQAAQVMPSSEASKPSSVHDFSDMGATTKRPFPLDVEAEIKAEALTRWPNNYDMQLFTIQQQTKALGTFNLWRSQGIPGVPRDVSARILRIAWDKWGTNFDMLIFSAEKEAKAWRELSGL